jgi:outer membrane protein assembly factor BamB
MNSPNRNDSPRRSVRWWPGALIVLTAIAAIVWTRLQDRWHFQQRNLISYQIVVVTVILLLAWWTFLSRAPKRLRLSITFGSVSAVLLGMALFRISGVSGDLFPILEFRWSKRPTPSADVIKVRPDVTIQRFNDSASFPQFLGPDRNGVLPGPVLETNWTAHPPQILWQQNVGAAWSGFAIVGNICLTQEQRAEDECVVAYDLLSGKQLWLHADKARYATTIAGEGPRATPNVRSNRVFTLGATGVLNCLDLSTGAQIWSRNVLAEDGGEVPDWGFAGSPLLVDELVIVHSGEGAPRTLLAFRADDGEPVWSAVTQNPSYASPTFATLAGVPQVLAFNDGNISAHDPASGALLWQRPWGNGNVVCASPVIVGTNRVLFSSGYGVGAELLEIAPKTNGTLAASLVWKSIRMKSKFAQMFVKDGCLFGLDDGILAAVDLRDGSQRWKEGRYGHGQGLLVGDLYLLMAENGELVLLRPTPDAPNELARSRVFNDKTWNPIALAGDLLLVRNDREAACLRLKVAEVKSE